MKSQESIGIDLINKCLKCLNQNSAGVVVACFTSDSVKGALFTHIDSKNSIRHKK